MPTDADRDGDRFGDRFDIAGVKPDSIELTVDKNVLTVRAERTWQPADGQEVMVAERPQGVFARRCSWATASTPSRCRRAATRACSR